MRSLSVCLGVILSWHFLFVQHTYACDWRAELLDTTSKEIKDFEIDDTPLTIPLLKPDNGVNVICVLQKEDVEKSEDEVSKVDIKSLYPDQQILHARAVTGLNFVTKRIITLPANLSFSSTSLRNKEIHKFTVYYKWTIDRTSAKLRGSSAIACDYSSSTRRCCSGVSAARGI